MEHEYLRVLADRLQACPDTDAKHILPIVGVDIFEYVQEHLAEDWHERLSYMDRLLQDESYMVLEKATIKAAKDTYRLCAGISDTLPEEIKAKQRMVHKNSKDEYETLKKAHDEMSDIAHVFPATVLRTARDRILGQLSFIYEIAQEVHALCPLNAELDEVQKTLRNALQGMAEYLDLRPSKMRLDSFELVNIVAATWHPGLLHIDILASRLEEIHSDCSAVKAAGIDVCHAYYQASVENRNVLHFHGVSVDLKKQVVSFKGIPKDFRGAEYWKIVEACAKNGGEAAIEDIDRRKTADDIDKLLYKMNEHWRSTNQRVFRRKFEKVWIDPQPVKPSRQK